MKISKNILLLFLIAAFSTMFFSCGDGALTTGDIPKSSLSVPEALTEPEAKGASRATSAGGTADDFFEPFRNSLKIAEEVLTNVNSIIDALNAVVVPDSWTGTQDNGDTVVVTTETARVYSKRIEFTSSGSVAPYLQINYTPGTVKGVIYYSEEDATSSLEKIKVFYDETGTFPVLQGWMIISPGTAEDTYPVSLYFNATKNASGNIIFEGGVSYNFVFGGHVTYTQNYTSDRTYMFKAFTSSDGTKAKVALYFPLSTVTTVTEAQNIKNSFLDILFIWLETENSVDLDSLLSQTPGTITDGTSLGTTLSGMDTADIPDDIEFVLSLTNPIAYDSVAGYMGNATTFPADAAYVLGDTGTLTFSLTPAAIKALSSAPGTTFTFLAD
ncbi:MAG: hypothetical protein JEZ04_11425 [Spirochaetales bacterium]|nr:hypothetical protein [Spirochaetales bacterium]